MVYFDDCFCWSSLKIFTIILFIINNFKTSFATKILLAPSNCNKNRFLWSFVYKLKNPSLVINVNSFYEGLMELSIEKYLKMFLLVRTFQSKPCLRIWLELIITLCYLLYLMTEESVSWKKLYSCFCHIRTDWGLLVLVWIL